MYSAGTNIVFADAIRRAKSPVCWRVDEALSQEALRRLAERGASFLFDWKKFGEEGKRLIQWLHHDYPFHFLLIDAGAIGEGEARRAFLERLRRGDMHGCVIDAPSHTLLKQCIATERFVFVRSDAQCHPSALLCTIKELRGQSYLKGEGRKNVGIALPWNPALLLRMEQDLSGVPLLLLCSAADWEKHPHAISAAVIAAPECRLIGLPAPPRENGDAWGYTYEAAARQLADVLQGALANRRRMQGG